MTGNNSWIDALAKEDADIDASLDAMANGSAPIDGDEETPEDVEAAEATVSDDESEGTIDGMFDAANGAVDDDAEDKGEAEAASTKQPEEVGALQARIKELEAALQRNRSEDGRARKLADENEKYRARITELEEQLNQKQSFKPIDGRMGQFNDAEKDLVSEDVAIMLGGRFARADQEIGDLRQKVAQLTEVVERQRNATLEGERASMKREILERFPGIEKMVNKESWGRFLNMKHPVAKESYAKLFHDAASNFDTDAMSSIVEDYLRVSSNSRGASGGVKPAEVSAGKSFPRTSRNQPKIYSVDEVNNFVNAFYCGKIPKTKETLARLKEYEAAMDDGRVQQ